LTPPQVPALPHPLFLPEALKRLLQQFANTTVLFYCYEVKALQSERDFRDSTCLQLKKLQPVQLYFGSMRGQPQFPSLHKPPDGYQLLCLVEKKPQAFSIFICTIKRSFLRKSDTYYFNILSPVSKQEVKGNGRKEHGRVLGSFILDSQNGTDRVSALKQRNP